MTRFLAIGECMVELAQTAPDLYKRGFAGDTFNTAWYARRLLPAEWRVGYLSGVGRDAVSDEMTAFIAAQGIDTDALRQVPGRTVGLYMISTDAGERSFSYWRGQSAARCLADDPAWLDARLAGADMIHFSGITLAILAPDRRDALCAALARARAAGATVSFDTNLRPQLWADAAAMQAGLDKGARVADIVLPSFDEETALFGDATPAQTIARYRAAGAGIVVVKNGAAALTLSGRDGAIRELQPMPVDKVVDSTAAGDSFAAALLAGLATGQSLDAAARTAMDLAAQVIQFPGALVPGIFSKGDTP